MSGYKDSLTIKGGHVIGDGEILENCEVRVLDGRISRVGPSGTEGKSIGRVVDAHGLYVSPGFIDLHVHGAAGANFLDAEEEAVKRAVATHTRYGTTCLLATIGTAARKCMEAGLVCLSNMIDNGSCDGLLGVHLEGPYLNPARRGAQPAGDILDPDRSELLNFLDLGGDSLKMVTLAPEVEGAIELVRLLNERECLPAIGHSNATYDEARNAFARGVRYVIHLFNAMSGLHHRQPGLAAAALLEKDLPVELIADGIHVLPPMIRLVLELKGFDGIVLATDCMEALDADFGEFRAGGRRVTVRDGVPQLDNGVLCGTMLAMNGAVKNFRDYTGAAIEEVVKAATINPARVLGIEDRKGSIAEGKDADIVIFDDDIEVMTTIIGGKIAHNSL